ncbi:hypothetical protein L21SP5_01075 [Salinivirga cyanobacteriivorans]|uniref:Nucleotidyl transferase AbiEii/AbiGii toxin family protein n=1 Tax=Salinivirga cyanobacteriivorans TaxID=1307839 RepID=A0A0S2HXE2_9BACT|nr:nucleotidyl transferase AbiEii/AbiGii toxin family protein [Salinivirga cyanobacteriivorans]ALO14739.1 hypothetical protein L21SP5_01075 [Salinivirga cyanobacteriivorans]
MNLHNQTKLFNDAIQMASIHLEIKPDFIVKDYWITYMLWNLSNYPNRDQVVFKGGTSLSKAYKLINRFSTDVDLAVIQNPEFSGNRIKSEIRKIEKTVAGGLKELEIARLTSKGSRFRKSAYVYPVDDKLKDENFVIVETNYFANPYPYEEREIESFIATFLRETGNEKAINDFNLQPFRINVLDRFQTLIEKLVSLIRFSFQEDSLEGVRSKIRHFYDLYYLLETKEGKEFITSANFRERFNNLLLHDQQSFDEPKGWGQYKLNESILVSDFERVWEKLKEAYIKELSIYAYAEIPDEKLIAESFLRLISQLKGNY